MTDELREALRKAVFFIDEAEAGHSGCNLNVGGGWAPEPLECTCGWDEKRDEWLALAATPKPALDVELPSFEVGQVVGELHPGRRRHDWCSIHGDIGPNESIDAHARRAHGSSAEAIRKARKVLKRAARLFEHPRHRPSAGAGR